MSYLLSLNCGSSSIKGKLFGLPRGKEDLEAAATISVSNIGSKGDKVSIKINWNGDKGEDVDTKGDEGDSVEHKDMFPILLDHISGSGGVKPDDITYITHRIVHGGTNTKPLVVTKDHEEALESMDALSEFAPLHNHHAVLGVRACLDSMSHAKNLLCFDTLFHQTLPEAVYAYALPPADEETVIPLRKYGFHGLSYASILSTLAAHESKSKNKMNLVVAHLGSGASACAILHGESVDTSMGLTPLEGLVGGTRTGTIDPTAIFHHTKDFAADAGLKGMKVTKAELVMNKKSGLTALAGTQNFGLITERKNNESDKDHKSAKLAYDVFLDRLMGFIAAYLSKILYVEPLAEVSLVFAGGIGEHASELRADVMKRLAWIGAMLDDQKNGEEGKVRLVSSSESKLKAYVVETDEEGWCAQMARDEFGF